MAYGGDENIPFSIPAADTSMENDDLMDGFVEETKQVISIMYEERYIEEHPEQSDVSQLPEPIKAVAETIADCTPEVKKIGRHLREVGDEIDKIYGSKIDGFVKDFFTINQGTPFERFKQVAASLLTTEWNMGRIMALLMFGYKIAMYKLTDCTTSFFGDVIKMVVKFLFLKNILGWVKGRGGWESVANSATSDGLSNYLVTLNTPQTVVVMGAVAILSGLLLIKFRS